MPAAASPRQDGTGYHAQTAGRDPRSLLMRACAELGPGDGRTAADVGCGSGADTLALLERGWTVTAVDRSESALGMLRGSVPEGSSERLTITCSRFRGMALPPAHFVYASYSLPFTDPAEFTVAWKTIRTALLPGGVFAGHLFGERDGWAGTDGMTFHRAAQVAELAGDLEVLYQREKEWDGTSASGPKRWHVYGVMFKRPEHGRA